MKIKDDVYFETIFFLWSININTSTPVIIYENELIIKVSVLYNFFLSIEDTIYVKFTYDMHLLTNLLKKLFTKCLVEDFRDGGFKWSQSSNHEQMS